MVRDETLVYFYGGYDDRQDEHVNTVYQLDLEKRVFSVVISNGTVTCSAFLSFACSV